MSRNKQISSNTSDTKQAEILKQAGIAAGAKANRESRALGLSVTYLEGDAVVEVDPDGNKRIITTKSKKAFNPELKTGTVLCRK